MSFLLLLAACQLAVEVAPSPAAPDLPTTTPTPTLPNGVRPPTDNPLPPADDPLVADCDAGTDAWVQRAMPVVLGRKPHGAAEVTMWRTPADTYGRDTVVRAWSKDPDYVRHWEDAIKDMIQIARTGVGDDSACAESPLMAVHDGSLADHIATYAPDDTPFGQPFNLADVIQDGLAADRLDVIWQVNVFARTNGVPQCGNTTDPKQIEQEKRTYLANEFLATYTNRDLTCITCHNSDYSVTDNSDPALDRTWGVDASFELALFGSSAGPTDRATYEAVHRFEGLVAENSIFGFEQYPITPWGMDDACGTFRRYPEGTVDFLGVNSTFFGSELGDEGSLWDLEAMLATGAETLASAPLGVAPDGQVAADEALAWLTAQNLTDQLWQSAFGERLTIAYGFSRNADQQARLEAATETFLRAGWSLSEAMVDITTDPLFNNAMACTVPAYSLPAQVDPYTVEDPDPARRGNGSGELVHRHFARTLLRAADDALEFPDRALFFPLGAFGDDDNFDLQQALGVALEAGDAGFNGTDFQGALAWEQSYATCLHPDSTETFLPRAITAAVDQGATVGDLALAVKDRLLAHGAWDSPDEEQLVADLLTVALDTPAGQVDRTSLQRNLGLFCGALTLSPDFFLTTEPRPVGPVPAVDLDWTGDCDRAIADFASQGIALACNGWMPQ